MAPPGVATFSAGRTPLVRRIYTTREYFRQKGFKRGAPKTGPLKRAQDIWGIPAFRRKPNVPPGKKRAWGALLVARANNPPVGNPGWVFFRVLRKPTQSFTPAKEKKRGFLPKGEESPLCGSFFYPGKEKGAPPPL